MPECYALDENYPADTSEVERNENEREFDVKRSDMFARKSQVTLGVRRQRCQTFFCAENISQDLISAKWRYV